MTRNYWRPKGQRARRSNTQVGTDRECHNMMRCEPVDPLYAAAVAASNRRNQLNYAWVADWSVSDVRPGDAERRKLRHVEELIQLVGEADKAWRRVAEARGEPYTACVDLGWMPRYTARAESLRMQLRAIEAAESSGAISAVDSTCPDCGESLTSSGACSVPCGE